MIDISMHTSICSGYKKTCTQLVGISFEPNHRIGDILTLATLLSTQSAPEHFKHKQLQCKVEGNLFPLRQDIYIILFFSVLLLVLLVATSATFARNIRCPGNLNPHEVVANSYDTTKYFMCTDEGMLEERTCAIGQEFDLKRLVCCVL